MLRVVPLQRVVLAEDAYFPTTPLLPLTPICEPLVRGRFVEKAPDIQPVLSRDRFDVLVLKLESLESPSSAMRRDDASARLWKYSISPCRSTWKIGFDERTEIRMHGHRPRQLPCP